MSSRSSSTSRRSAVKNSITASLVAPRTENPNALCRPARAATRARGSVERRHVDDPRGLLLGPDLPRQTLVGGKRERPRGGDEVPAVERPGRVAAQRPGLGQRPDRTDVPPERLPDRREQRRVRVGLAGGRRQHARDRMLRAEQYFDVRAHSPIEGRLLYWERRVDQMV